MTTGVQFPVPNRHASGQSRSAVRFFVLATGVFAVALALAIGLGLLFGRPVARTHFWVPPAFAVSTLLLIAGSTAMTKAVAAVRRRMRIGQPDREIGLGHLRHRPARPRAVVEFPQCRVRFRAHPQPRGGLDGAPLRCAQRVVDGGRVDAPEFAPAPIGQRIVRREAHVRDRVGGRVGQQQQAQHERYSTTTVLRLTCAVAQCNCSAYACVEVQAIRWETGAVAPL